MSRPARTSRRFFSRSRYLMAVAIGTVAVLGATQAAAATTPVDLQTAAAFAVLAGSTVTNTGPSIISGDVGVNPGTALTGFPPGIVINGTIHDSDAVAGQAQADATTAYNQAAGESPVTLEPTDLTGLTLDAGVYDGTPQGGPIGLTGTVTLNGQGDPNAVFVFQTNSTLITGTSSVVALENGANACNVFWQVGSSATLGPDSTFTGTVDALTSITADTGATIEGRLLARNGAVTLDDNVITAPTCSATPPTTTTVPATTTVPTTTPVSTTTPGSITTTVPATTTTPVSTTTSVSTTAPKTATTLAASTTTPQKTTAVTTPTVNSTIGNGIRSGLGGGGATTTLASTGSDATLTTVIGLTLIAAGGLAIWASKVRPNKGQRHPQP